MRFLLKQRALLIAMLAVTAPLAFIVHWQYRTLRTLERTLPVYRKEYMNDYLRKVASEVESFYRTAADRTLKMPGSVIANREGGVVKENKDGNGAVAATRKVAEHFSNNPFEGARRLFVVVDTESQWGDRAAVLFFSPERQSLEPDATAPELRAINVACASYVIYIRSGAQLDSRAMGIDRDPWHPLIVKPILDEHERIVAVAGMVVDGKFFMDHVLPEAVHKYLLELFPDDAQDVVVAVSDEAGEPVWGAEPIGMNEYEARMPFWFIFQRWTLANRMRHETEEQWARRYFAINVSILGALALLLVGGVALTLRVTSRAMKLSEMKSDFVSNVSHELRTPIASIRVFGEFFKLGRVNEPQKIREYGEYIETESRRLTGLINNILDFSKIESGQKAYKLERADLSEVVADTLKTFEVRLRQADFDIGFETPRTPLPDVRIDSDAIAQALVNLLDNAVKYSGESRKITVRLAQEEGWVTISVIDHGVGIPVEEQDKIFERFHRVSTGLVHEVRGSGLGLAIVKHIVDAHRGKVTVRSEPGSGSTFTIYLPVDQQEVAGRQPRREPVTNA